MKEKKERFAANLAVIVVLEVIFIIYGSFRKNALDWYQVKQAVIFIIAYSIVYFLIHVVKGKLKW